VARTKTILVSHTPNLTASEYTIGMQFGQIVKISESDSVADRGVRVAGLMVLEKKDDPINVILDFFFFSEDPTGSMTNPGDFKPIVITASGLFKCVGCVEVRAQDYIAIGENGGQGSIAYAQIKESIGMSAAPDGNQNELWMLVQIRTTCIPEVGSTHYNITLDQGD